MAMKLSTTLGHIDNIPNSINGSLVKDFYEYLKEVGTSKNYPKNHSQMSILEVALRQYCMKENINSYLYN